jgi:hypothetical protein
MFDILRQAAGNVYNNFRQGRGLNSFTYGDVIPGVSVHSGPREPVNGVFGISPVARAIPGILQGGPTSDPSGSSDQSSGGGSSGGSGGFGGGSYSVAPAMIRASLQDKIDMLNNLYNALTSDLITLTQDRRNILEGDYGRQRGDLQKSYEKSQAVLPSAFAARNTRNSSYYDQAVQDAADTYNTNMDAINRDREAKLAQIGREYASQDAQIAAARAGLSQINPNFYGTQADLDTTRQSLDRQGNDLGVQRAGLSTQGGYLGRLNAVSAAPNTGTTDLQAQLQKVITSDIPGFAKDTIAKGLIKNAAPGQQKELEDYYANIQAGKNNVPYAA